MRVNNRANIRPRREEIPMKAPLARWAAAAEPPSIEMHQRNIGDFELFVEGACRADKETALVTANTDVPGRAIRQTTARQLTTRGDERLRQR
jgi:hypothetical protein